ncbi:MAG: GspH/FimT family protein [Comamonadaceae bacterium]
MYIKHFVTKNTYRYYFSAGYSLVELLVVLTLSSILALLAVPSMTAMINTQRSISLGNAFLAGLNLARNEAIKRNARTVLCKSSDGLSCTTSGGWQQGWIMFHDVNNNALLDVGEQVIQSQAAVSQGLSLTGNTNVANYVSYSASGSSKLISGAFQAGTFSLCLDPVVVGDVRQIVLSSTGRARSKKGLASDCS